MVVTNLLGRWSVLGLILLDLLDWYLNDHCWIDIGILDIHSMTLMITSRIIPLIVTGKSEYRPLVNGIDPIRELYLALPCDTVLACRCDQQVQVSHFLDP